MDKNPPANRKGEAMFDRTIITNPTEIREVEKTITINRAPTDKSVELLNDFQDKAVKNIVTRIVINDNTFNCAGIVVRDSISAQHFFYYKFTINKKEFNGKIVIDIEAFMETGTFCERLTQKIKDEVSGQLMDLIMKTDNFFNAAFGKKLKET